MGKIQGKIIKRGKRSIFSRALHTKDDVKAAAAWRLDLDKIRRVFEVRSSACVRRLLTFSSQTELTINTDVNIPHSISETHTTVSGLDNDTSNTGVPENYYGASGTPAVIPRVYHEATYPQSVIPKARGDLEDNNTSAVTVLRNKVEYQEHTDGRNRAVSAIFVLSDVE